MTLTDAGPLIALIDADEADHRLGVEALRHLPLPLVTTWPAFTEAMYLLSRAGGPTGGQALWRLVFTGRLELADLDRAGIERSAALMDKYAHRPMDLADATLVALAEARNARRIFTRDAEPSVGPSGCAVAHRTGPEENGRSDRSRRCGRSGRTPMAEADERGPVVRGGGRRHRRSGGPA